MTWQAVVLIVAILLFGVISWLGRYEVVGVAPGGQGINGMAYRLDRWTGEVVCIQGVSAAKIEIH